jgi:hypothetical protein
MQEICETIELSALLRGTGAKRTPEYIQKNGDSRRRYCTRQREICRFCYIESWQHGKFVLWLDRSSDYRNLGLAKKIKSFVFDYSLKNIQKQKFSELQQA